MAPLYCSVKSGDAVSENASESSPPVLTAVHVQPAQEADAVLCTCCLSDTQYNKVHHRITGLLVGRDLWRLLI